MKCNLVSFNKWKYVSKCIKIILAHFLFHNIACPLVLQYALKIIWTQTVTILSCLSLSVSFLSLYLSLQYPGKLRARPDPGCQSSGGIYWATAVRRNLWAGRLLRLRPHGVRHWPSDQQSSLQTGVVQVSPLVSVSVLHSHFVWLCSQSL